MSDNDDKNYNPSRRKFVKNTGMIIGGVAGGSLLGGILTNQFQTKSTTDEPKEDKKKETFTEARMFFTRYEDFVVLEQATERIYPEDDNGPGAIELGVPYFIDKQLAGSWGKEFKEKSLFYTNRNLYLTQQGGSLPWKLNYMDLDPNFKDAFGDPLLRVTCKYTDQDRNSYKYARQKSK